MIDRRGSLLCLPYKALLAPALRLPPLPGVCAAMGALGNPVEQDMGTGVQSVGCRAQKAGCRLWGVGHQAWDAGHELPVGQYCPGGVMAVRCQCDALYCVKLSFYLRRELRTAKEQVFFVFGFFFFFLLL